MNKTERVRVFVPTYQRPLLLERALRSLVGQNFQNWIAEVHNDDPNDAAPGFLVKRLGDQRISLVQHETNWGALKTFNEIYSAHNDEEFIGLLEDDNAWEPNFLERLIELMDADPEVLMAWSNQSLDLENAEGGVSPMGRTARQLGKEGCLPSGKYDFGHPAQAFGCLHANGAMLLRIRVTGALKTPLTIPFTGMESFRERLIKGRIQYTEEPLARFTVTKQSARGGEALLGTISNRISRKFPLAEFGAMRRSHHAREVSATIVDRGYYWRMLGQLGTSSPTSPCKFP